MIFSNFILIGSYSIVLAAIIVLFRIKRIHRSYHPFLCIIFAAVINEISSNLLIHFNFSNAIAINMMGLAELMLWMWQFRRWHLFRNNRWKVNVLITALAATWVIENIILNKLNTFSSAYSIAYSFTLVFLSINCLNKQILEETRTLFTNPKFLICSGNIIFSTYRILIESFYLLQLEGSDVFLTNVFLILAFVNLFVNLLFALATLWIPTRLRFSLQYL